MTAVRYLVRDVDQSVAFYRKHLGFAVKQQGVHFRNDIVTGPGGQQILCEDPSGNVIDLFQPA